jgi:hypothetical protein
MELLDCPPRGMFWGGPQAITAHNTAVLTSSCSSLFCSSSCAAPIPQHLLWNSQRSQT